ncbi:MAG: hypothetical protein AAFV93_18710 [Chloroflexota bacterium]
MSAGTITLLIYIIVLTPMMLLGYYFARRKMFKPQHQLTMTAIVILNWILIGVVMLNSYAGVASELPENISEPFVLLPTIHGLIGLTAQLSATYLVLLMWTENTPLENIVIYRIKNIKTPMRVTLSLWFLTVLLGFGVYGVWYGNPLSAEADSPLPAVTEAVDDVSPDAVTTEEAGSPDTATTEEASTDDELEPATTEEASTDESDADNNADPEPATTEEASSDESETDDSSAPEPATTEEAQ